MADADPHSQSAQAPPEVPPSAGVVEQPRTPEPMLEPAAERAAADEGAPVEQNVVQEVESSPAAEKSAAAAAEPQSAPSVAEPATTLINLETTTSETVATAASEHAAAEQPPPALVSEGARDAAVAMDEGQALSVCPPSYPHTFCVSTNRSTPDESRRLSCVHMLASCCVDFEYVEGGLCEEE